MFWVCTAGWGGGAQLGSVTWLLSPCNAASATEEPDIKLQRIEISLSLTQIRVIKSALIQMWLVAVILYSTVLVLCGHPQAYESPGLRCQEPFLLYNTPPPPPQCVLSGVSHATWSFRAEVHPSVGAGSCQAIAVRGYMCACMRACVHGAPCRKADHDR